MKRKKANAWEKVFDINKYALPGTIFIYILLCADVICGVSCDTQGEREGNQVWLYVVLIALWFLVGSIHFVEEKESVTKVTQF